MSHPRAGGLLRTFLSSENVNSATPVLHPPEVIVHLYKSAQSHDQHLHLDLSALVSLFGSLCVPPPPRRSKICDFMHPLAPLLLQQGSDPRYWPFVLQVFEEKRRLRQALTTGDRFWAMRAELAQADFSNDDPSRECPSTVLLNMLTRLAFS
jgi:hypothetical protein